MNVPFSMNTSHALRLEVIGMKLTYKQKGLAIVEFSIVSALLLMIMFAICEFGIMLYDKAVITNASREAARAGIVLKNPKPTTAQIQAVATTYRQAYLINFHTGVTPTVTVTEPSSSFGTPLTVNITYSYYNLVFGNLLNLVSGGAFPNPLILSATTTMNNE
jgi:Flp pilus assembly protein TadG